LRPLVLSGGATGIEMRFDPFNDGMNGGAKDGSIVLLRNSNILLPPKVITSNDISSRPHQMEGASTLHPSGSPQTFELHQNFAHNPNSLDRLLP
jgi:hypothetical protein